MIDEPDRTLHFVADAESIEDLEKDQKRDDHWQKGIQDNLTYMLQASIEVAKGNTEFTLPVFEKSKTKSRRKASVHFHHFEDVRSGMAKRAAGEEEETLYIRSSME